MSRDALSVVRAVAPELTEVLKRRYAVLEAIDDSESIGRRALAQRLGWPERTARSETDILRDLGLIEHSGAGMEISAAGIVLLHDLKLVVDELHGLSDLEAELARTFNLQRAHVVPGDSDRDVHARSALARAAGEALVGILRSNDVVAVSGGSTMAEVARQVSSPEEMASVTVVPTGGGLGDRLEIEANAVAAQLAGSLGARYRLLHLRDDLNESTVEALLNAQPIIRDIFALIRSARVVVQGVGALESVAARRRMPKEATDELAERGAVGETLGYFYDINGQVVRSTSSVGLRLEDLGGVEQVLVVAGGESKTDALVGLLVTRMQHTLVTDEAAARAIVRRMRPDA